MSNQDELNIIMVGTPGIGKTSLLAAMHEEFNKTFERANLQTWVEDTNTLLAIEDCKSTFRNIDPRLNKKIVPNDPKENPWVDRGFLFDLGSNGKKFMTVRFTDPSGEYFNASAAPKQKDYIKEQLNECNALIIPINSTALMQKKTGRVNHAEIGTWHQEKNTPERITQLIKDAYVNLTSPRLIIFAPIKCESYTQTPQDAEKLLDAVKIGYRHLIDFLRSESLIDKVSVVITPVQTIGNVVYSHYSEDESGLTRFWYHKTPIDAPYAPKDGDQPLRYVLLFSINVYLETKQRILEQIERELKDTQQNRDQEIKKLENIQEQLDRKRQLLDERNNSWWLWRGIANLFNDRETPYQEAKQEFETKQVAVEEIETKIEITSQTIEATQEQINTFNNALFRFAIGAKNSDGFAIIQGHKRLAIPQQTI